MAEHKTVAIIGHGYVGQAVEKLMETHYSLVIYDPKFEARRTDYSEQDKITLYGATKEDVNECDLAVVCVPTPQNEDGSCDSSILKETLEWVKCPLTLVKSTTPPKDLLELEEQYGICFSPEYIGEGKYFVPFWRYPHPTDMRYHDFMIIGGDKEKAEKIFGYFLPILGPSCRFVKTDIMTAALAKYMENAWGAMKVTFCNEWYEISKHIGIDYQELRELFLMDGRTERMHTMVMADKRGFGGKCYPKDVNAIVKFSQDSGFDPEIHKQVLKSNDKFRTP